MPSALRSHPVLLAFLLYLALGVVLTWPLAAGVGSTVPLGDNDIWQNYWNAWWWKRALTSGQSPFHTDLLFHPTGASLGWHTHSPANMIAVLPAVTLAGRLGLDGPAAAISLATLAGFVLAGLGAHLLARELVGPGSAVLAGIVFAFFPQHVEQSLEHLNLTSFWAMPFALLFIARAARGEGARAWIPAGAFLALNALLSWHNAVLVLFIAVALAVSEILRAPRRGRALLDLVLAGLLSFLIVLPFLWPMLAEAVAGAGGFKRPTHKPIDPLFLVIPHAGHPLWGSAVAGLHARFRAYPSAGFVSYLGLAAMGLWGVAAAYRARPAVEDPASPPERPSASRTFWFWTVLALVHLVLSLGRSPRIGGVDFPGVSLPFALLDSVPGLNAVRVANRFLVPAMLSIAVLAGMGGEVILRNLVSAGRRRWAASGLAAILVLDYLWVPYPTREVPRPAWLQAMPRLPAGLAVLDVPTGAGPRAADDMRDQTRHARPLAGGYVSRTPPEIERTLREHPVLRQVFEAHPPPPPRGASLVEAARALDLGIVVLHLDRSMDRIEEERSRAKREHPTDLYRLRLYNPEKGIHPADLERIQRELRTLGPPVYSDPDTEIYLIAGGG